MLCLRQRLDGIITSKPYGGGEDKPDAHEVGERKENILNAGGSNDRTFVRRKAVNQYNRKPSGKLEVCPHCGRDSGERKIGIHVPERYCVRCASCGFTLSGWSQSAATASWNRLSKKVRT